MDFICEHADHREFGGLRWGVEPICRVFSAHGVKIALSAYYEWRDRLPTDRQRRDELLKNEICRVWGQNFQVYGARKVWLQLNREHLPVARCTVERLMRQIGIQGVSRGKVKRTTKPDGSPLAADLVNRRFAPLAPNLLWLADFVRREVLMLPDGGERPSLLGRRSG